MSGQLRAIFCLSSNRDEWSIWKGMAMRLKRRMATISLGLISLCLLMTVRVTAAEGELGFFGGVSEGDYLPKTIDKYVAKKPITTRQYQYKEMIFLTAKPVEVRGTLTVKSDPTKADKDESGNLTEEYNIDARSADGQVELKRQVKLTTAFRNKEGSFKRQLIKDSTLDSWKETIKSADQEFTVDSEQSTFSKSTVEDKTPGVIYYTTTLSYKLVYKDGEERLYNVTVDGDVYGYKQPWSRIESQDLSLSIASPAAKFYRDVKIKPRLEAKKTMYYEASAPYPISFGGTYNQRMERKGFLDYEILTEEADLTLKQRKNSLLLTTANQVEKLPIPENLDFLHGHWAEKPMKRLYSMEILTDLPHNGMQYEAMKRGDFVKALCRALNIDTSAYAKPKEGSPQIFGDIPYYHPLYPYIMGAYDAKLVRGTGENFSVNQPITRQEAFVIYIRVIGLERLGVSASPITPFVDDSAIANWAKKEIMAGYKLGIIQGNDDGQVLPEKWLAKVEAAAIINRLVDYLREDLGKDYLRQ